MFQLRLLKNKQCEKVVFSQESNLLALDLIVAGFKLPKLSMRDDVFFSSSGRAVDQKPKGCRMNSFKNINISIKVKLLGVKNVFFGEKAFI